MPIAGHDNVKAQLLFIYVTFNLYENVSGLLAIVRVVIYVGDIPRERDNWEG